KTHRTHVSRVHRLLAPDRELRTRPDLLVSVADGYALRIEPAGVDAAVFEDLYARGERAHAAGDLDTAHRLLTAALDKFDGEPLAGVPGPAAAAWRNRLAERRLAAVEARAEVDLAAGRYADLLAELSTLVAAHPLRERFRALLMRALCAAGRRAEALGAYAEARRVLV